MKRFRRMISRVGDGICIVLMVFMAFMFVRGYWVVDLIWYESREGQSWQLASGEGGAHLFWTMYFRGEVGLLWDRQENQDHVMNWWFERSVYAAGSVLFVPYWVVFVFIAIKPIWSLIAWRRRKRRALPGHPLCDRCGYDLHGTTSSVCPECGATVGTLTEVAASTPR